MAVLRLFANLRELAGSSRLDIEAETVGGVIDEAQKRFGPEFERTLARSRVWKNGRAADPEEPVANADEIVVLPPVSGGGDRGYPAPAVTAADLMFLFPVGALAVLILANLVEGPAWWAAAIAVVVAIWAADLDVAAELRSKPFAAIAVVLTAGASTVVAHSLGDLGYGLSLVLAVIITLGWAVGFDGYRAVDAVAPSVLVAVLAGLGASSMVLARSEFVADIQAVDVFLVAVVTGLVLGGVVERLPPLPLLDPFSVTAIGAVGGALVSAALWDLDMVGYLLVGLGVAVALVAGRGFGSMIRTGALVLSQRGPGAMTAIDGAILAAAIYFPLIRVIL